MRNPRRRMAAKHPGRIYLITSQELEQNKRVVQAAIPSGVDQRPKMMVRPDENPKSSLVQLPDCPTPAPLLNAFHNSREGFFSAEPVRPRTGNQKARQISDVRPKRQFKGEDRESLGRRRSRNGRR